MTQAQAFCIITLQALPCFFNRMPTEISRTLHVYKLRIITLLQLSNLSSKINQYYNYVTTHTHTHIIELIKLQTVSEYYLLNIFSHNAIVYVINRTLQEKE